MLAPELLLWMQICCGMYAVEPEFALAVAKVESGCKQQEFRVGRLGRSKFYGPMGIAGCYLKKWPIDNPWENVRVGVRALQGADKLRVLRRYNTTCTPQYVAAVMQNYRRFKREKICK